MRGFLESGSGSGWGALWWGRRGVVLGCVLGVLGVVLGRAEGVRASKGVPAAAAVPARVTGVREADAACARCHAAIVAKYVDSPMANGSGVATEHLVPGTMRHAASGMEYRVGMVAGQPTLEYARRSGGSGESEEVHGSRRLEYFLGSGRLGTTYLYSEDGYLEESLVAWYSHLKGYAMAPGLEAVTTMPAALPMEPGCMRCHMSDVQRVTVGSRDHFAGLPFLHGGVTCEGCHGDTTAHVSSGGKTAVVNPMKLDAGARDAVCASCHLEGDVSVDRRGRTPLEYRPGDRLDTYATHLVFHRDSTSRSVSETEQLLTSRCKRESGDRMSCMSCHDAHGDPAPEDRVLFYRAKCLACHGVDAGFTRTHFPDKPDCTACHMPKNGATDTPHVAWTDHRLLRRPESGPGAPAVDARAGLLLHGPGSEAVAESLQPVLSSETPTPRDLALGYYKAMLKGHPELAREAWTRLNAAAAADATDAAVLVALGYMNAMQGKVAEAGALLRAALRLEPNNEEARSDEATLLARSGEVDAATVMARGAFAQDEDSEVLGVNLALLECAGGQREQGLATLRTVLRFSPDSARARQAGAQCGAGTGSAR